MSRFAMHLKDNQWIPWVFVAMFGVVIVANGTLIYFALNSWTGLTAQSAYKQGLSVNRALAAAEAQARLGWTAAAGLRQTAPGRGQLRFVLKEAGGASLNGAAVEVRMVRPLNDEHDFTVTLNGIGRGAYVADVIFPRPGQWEARFAASHGRRKFKATQRMMVK